MGFYTGTAASTADLLAKISTHLTVDQPGPEQWTVTGDVFSQGTCYVEILDRTTHLAIIAGTGESGGSITGEPPLIQSRNSYASLGNRGTDAIVFPATYWVNAHEKEVYVTVKNGTKYCHMFFGQSGVPTNPGTGNWYYASVNRDRAFSSGGWDSRVASNNTNSYYENGTLLCGASTTTGAISNTDWVINQSFHHGLDGNDWTMSGISGPGSVGSSVFSGLPSFGFSYQCLTSMYQFQPNAFNDQAVLFKMPVFVLRGDSKTTIIAELVSIRAMRMDSYQPEDIITVGGQSWILFPPSQKDPANPAGRNGGYGSGNHGYAIKYDGP